MFTPGTSPLLPPCLELNGSRHHNKQIECLKKYCFKVLRHVVGARYTQSKHNQWVCVRLYLLAYFEAYYRKECFSFPTTYSSGHAEGVPPKAFIRQRRPKNLRDTQRWWRERVGQGETGSKETREQGTLFCSTWFHKLVEFIVYKRTSWTARQQLLREPGEVGRGLCQSAAGKMISFLY